MTKEITKSIILQEIQDQFGLREFIPEKFLFSESVVPIYDIGHHTKRWTSERHRFAVSANATMLFYTVPENERIKIRKIDIMNEAGGNFDVSQVFIDGPSGAYKTQYIFYDTTTPIASGTVNLFEFRQDISMEDGELMKLYIKTINFVAGGYVSMHILKEVETIR